MIPRQHFESALLAPLLDILHRAEFRQAVGRMPGYDPSRMGELVASIE